MTMYIRRCQSKRRLVAAAVACATASCICVIFMKINVRSTPPLLTTNCNGLVEAIAARASQDRYIILALVDESFVDMAINLHEASLKPHYIDNYLFVGVGNLSCDVLHRQSLACFHYVNDPSAGKASDYGTVNFARKVNIRNDMISEAINANFTVVTTDVDVAFLGNPLDEIKVI